MQVDSGLDAVEPAQASDAKFVGSHHLIMACPCPHSITPFAGVDARSTVWGARVVLSTTYCRTFRSPAGVGRKSTEMGKNGQRGRGELGNSFAT